jgi:hypothetical protein
MDSEHEMHVELLIVEDTFQIEGRGLVILPNFSVPETGWKNRAVTVSVMMPNGDQFDATARFDVEHFSFRDPTVPADRRWRVAVVFQDRSKEEIPIGSKILVHPELRSELLSEN